MSLYKNVAIQHAMKNDLLVATFYISLHISYWQNTVMFYLVTYKYNINMHNIAAGFINHIFGLYIR